MIGDFYEGSDLKLKIELEGMEFNQDSDSEVLEQYLSDSNWQSAGSKYLNLLAPWSNYSGPYKNNN